MLRGAPKGHDSSVANYRKQESLNSQVIDFPIHGFRILPRKGNRSYWIPGAYAPVWSEQHKSFLSLLKNKGFKKARMTHVGLYAIGTSTPLESNKSLHYLYLTPLFFSHYFPLLLVFSVTMSA